MTKPVEARVAILGGGPIAPALAQTLARGGVAEIVLVGDALLGDVDQQQSRLIARSDVGRPTSEVVGRLIAGSETKLTVIPERPTTKLDWQRLLRGLSFAVAPIAGPVLFHPWIDTLNEAAQDAGIPWTTVAILDGKELHVGPTIVPGKTACWKCYELRYKSNLGLLDAYLPFEKLAQTLTETKDLGILPPVVDIVAGLAASEVLRFLGGAPAVSVGKLLTFDTSAFILESHPVLRLPRCAVCTPAVNAPGARAWS